MIQEAKALVISHLWPPSDRGRGGLGSNVKKNCDGLSPIDFFPKKSPLLCQLSPISSYFMKYLPGFFIAFTWLFGMPPCGAFFSGFSLAGGFPGIFE